MVREFSGSTNLAVILKWHGWGLYDVTTQLPREDGSFSWDELVTRETDQYLIGHQYYLLPSLKEGESLKQAYASFRDSHTHPILRIPKVLSTDEKRFGILAKDGFSDRGFNCYYLNELYFREDKLITSSYIFFSHNYPSKVHIPAPNVVDTFSRYFCLLQFTDKGTVIKKPTKDVLDIN